MKILNRRAATRALVVTGLLAATSGAVPLTAASTASAVDPMVSHARAYIGTYQGQCKVFVQKIHAEVYANTLGTGYYQAYLNAGYHRVTKAEVLPGDVIQETDASHTRGIHTAIVTGDPDGPTIRVVDSNWVAPNKVGEHAYDPTAHAQNNGGTAYYWRK